MNIYLAIFFEGEAYAIFGFFSDKNKLFEALRKAYETEKARDFEPTDIYNYFSAWLELQIYKAELDQIPNLEKGEMIESIASFSCEYPIYKQLAFLDNLKSFIESIH